jgi:phosphotransferase system enzyme I (PtsI)
MSQREEVSSNGSKPSLDSDPSIDIPRAHLEIVLKADKVVLPGKGLGALYLSHDMECPDDEKLESREAIAADLAKLEDAFGQYKNVFSADIMLAAVTINTLFKNVEKAKDPWEQLVNDCIPELLTYSGLIENTDFFASFMQYRGALDRPEQSAEIVAVLIESARTELLGLVNEKDIQEGGKGEHTSVPPYMASPMQYNTMSSFGAVRLAVRKARELVKTGHGAAVSVFSTFTEIADGQPAVEMMQEVVTARSEFLKLLLSEIVKPEEPVILAGSLVSVPTVKNIPDQYLAGIISKTFGNVSHVKSVCGDLDIPILVLDDVHFEMLEEFASSETILIDGDAGEVIVNPSTERLADYYRTLTAIDEISPIAACTRDGTAVQLDVTISNASNPVLERVESLGVGIGLVRTELVIDSPEASEEEQVAIYKKIIEASKGSVDIRTFDLTNDKAGLRTSQSVNAQEAISNILKEDLVRQLKSVLRAAWELDREPRIFFPQVQSAREMQEYSDLVYKHALPALGVEPKDLADLPTIRLGAQVESLAGIENLADILASVSPAIDFVTLGSTDLGNDVGHQVEGHERDMRAKDDVDFYNPQLFKALKEASGILMQVAPEIPVRVCGALAQSAEFFPVLIGLGYSSLGPDVNAAKALEQAITAFSMADCEELTTDILGSLSSEEVKEKLTRFKDARVS